MSEPTYEGRFDACEHPWDRKYVVSGRGIVCLDCETSTLVVRWDEPGADPVGDVQRWSQRIRDGEP